MKEENFVIKKIFDGEKYVDVKFYQNITRKRMTKFLNDVEFYNAVLEGISDLFLQQYVHALLIIKHFTNFEVKADNPEDIINETKRFTNTGLISQFSSKFDQNIISEINQITIMHFLTVYGDVPEYLKFGTNKKFLNQIKTLLLDETSLDELFDITTEKFNQEKKKEKNFYSMKYQTYSNKKNKQQKSDKKVSKNITSVSIKRVIDNLLDEYNDYMSLYKLFGDEEYLERANHIMKVLNGEETYEERL